MVINLLSTVFKCSCFVHPGLVFHLLAHVAEIQRTKDLVFLCTIVNGEAWLSTAVKLQHVGYTTQAFALQKECFISIALSYVAFPAALRVRAPVLCAKIT